MRHLEGPKNPDFLILDVQIFVYVYKVHMCIYMLRGGMRSCVSFDIYVSLLMYMRRFSCKCVIFDEYVSFLMYMRHF